MKKETIDLKESKGSYIGDFKREEREGGSDLIIYNLRNKKNDTKGKMSK